MSDSTVHQHAGVFSVSFGLL